MEHLQRDLKENEEYVYPHEYEQASNSYLMAVVAVIAGLPLPVINLIASVGFYMGHRKASYFVRWHCIQSIIAQSIMIPFNSVAFGWTLSIIINKRETDLFYITYLSLIVFLNVVEFFAVVITAAKVRSEHNVRWFMIAGIADSLCSRENRDPYKL